RPDLGRPPGRPPGVAGDLRPPAGATGGDLHVAPGRGEDLRHAGRPGGQGHGPAIRHRRPGRTGPGQGHRQAGGGGAPVPRSDQDHRGPGDPGSGVRQVERPAPSFGTLGGVQPRYLVRTFGCQMNEHDSERIAGLLDADGLAPAQDPGLADVVVLNTCAVRENADNRLYGSLGHLKPLKDANPRMRIVVAGCLAQKDRGLIQRKAPWVDVVVGTHALAGLVELIRSAERDGPQMDVREFTEVFPSALPAHRGSRSHAWVAVSVGCDNACTFCIVPLVRGPQLSRPLGDILAEVQGLTRTGVVEVTLLGQNVNTYGRDLT